MSALKTRMTELFGIEYPIQCGTMQWLSRSELVAAVARAGGLACLAAASFPTPEALATEIRKTRDLTDKPFGVNVSLFPTLRRSMIEEFINTAAGLGVKILETAGRNPEPYLPLIRKSGFLHLHKCARLRDAIKAAGLGVDAVAVVSTESGGHPGPAGITTMVLAPSAAQAVSIPLIVGGGICDGRTLAAALALGADGVVMGTRFICTRECGAHPEIKRRLLDAEADETMMLLGSLGPPGRFLSNRRAQEVAQMEREGKSLEEMVPFIRGEISLAAWMDGTTDTGLLACGQAVGRIRDLPGVSELMARIIAEAREAAIRLGLILL